MTSALDPAVIAAVDDLELVARQVVEGFRSGPHRSPFHGYSTEFRQHRAYRTGDDFRHLDWKLLARTNRLYTRQFRETTNMSVMIVVDASASMAFPEAGVSKWRYATVLAAALAYLTITQGDRVGLLARSGDRFVYLPPKGGRAHLRALLARLDRLTPAGDFAGPRLIARAAELLRRRGLLCVLSDFYDDEDATRTELRRAARRGHQIAALQVLSPDELALPYRGAVDLEDLETGAHRIVPADAIAAAHRTAMREFLDRWQRETQRDGFDFACLTTDMPPARALRAFLLHRGSPRHVSRGTAEKQR